MDNEPLIATTAKWKSAYVGASLGVLALDDVANPGSSPALDAEKRILEEDLRSRFGSLSRKELKQHPQLEPYTLYYKRFDKTYHVQHQLETIVHKGKAIPRVAALVEAMFMGELKNLLLTAGHDLDQVQGTLTLDLATGSETYTGLAGQEQTLKQGDMYIHDEQGILSSILYGPDRRTRIMPGTTHVLFTVYAPAGIQIDRVRGHLEDLAAFAQLVSPEAVIEQMQVLPAG